jgi:hypothetical protein
MKNPRQRSNRGPGPGGLFSLSQLRIRERSQGTIEDWGIVGMIIGEIDGDPDLEYFEACRELRGER